MVSLLLSQVNVADSRNANFRIHKRFQKCWFAHLMPDCAWLHHSADFELPRYTTNRWDETYCYLKNSLVRLEVCLLT